MKKNGLAILVLIGLIGYGAYDYVTGATKETIRHQSSATNENLPIGIEKGQRAPNFTLNDLNGNPIQLADYRGKKVLINFWASWCPPCRAEMPHMQQFYEDYQKDTVILGVNLTSTEDSPKDVRPFIEEFGLTFPIVMDEEGALMADYTVIAYPTTFVLDEQGVIREIFRGAINYEIMQKTVDAF
ncbi:TlpA family protein disulfide reductase [Paenibacillus sp. DXFW5]|uniref:TlpA family protein disulfide reductase n=1 Tax=Paenibacillus rhizolycopersici TaxID=2780073 RepID=A0ABS2H692_9BACL|nr:TlpA disulfide reductase family protein [Paenibacillus rhizolycopersici]MBM6996316.1 TlpA family protein disulfide reductase [Paenibacillus rhizolycopersici]